MKRNNYYLFVCSFIPDCHGQARYLKDNAWWTKFKDGSDLYKHRATKATNEKKTKKKTPKRNCMIMYLCKIVITLFRATCHNTFMHTTSYLQRMQFTTEIHGLVCSTRVHNAQRSRCVRWAMNCRKSFAILNMRFLLSNASGHHSPPLSTASRSSFSRRRRLEANELYRVATLFFFSLCPRIIY